MCSSIFFSPSLMVCLHDGQPHLTDVAATAAADTASSPSSHRRIRAGLSMRTPGPPHRRLVTSLHHASSVLLSTLSACHVSWFLCLQHLRQLAA